MPGLHVRQLGEQEGAGELSELPVLPSGKRPEFGVALVVKGLVKPGAVEKSHVGLAYLRRAEPLELPNKDAAAAGDQAAGLTAARSAG